jgi:hypothetical protein
MYKLREASLQEQAHVNYEVVRIKGFDRARRRLFEAGSDGRRSLPLNPLVHAAEFDRKGYSLPESAMRELIRCPGETDP